MLKTVTNINAETAVLRRRRRDIEGCLASHGLRRRGARYEDGYSQRLRQALEYLGPVFSAFGLYLASRADLLPLRDCLELAAIADWAEATPSAAVEAVIARELGRPLGTVYRVFDAEPFVSRLLYQLHHAVLHNGQAVTVKIIHPVVQEDYASDPELLPVLQNILSHASLPSSAIDDAIADFCHTWRQRLNLLHEVKALEVLAHDSHNFAMLWIPNVHREFSSLQVITYGKITGAHLGELMALTGKLGTSTVARVGLDEAEIARRLYFVWLRQALFGSQFPVEVHPEDIVILPSKQITFANSLCMGLPLAAKKNLLNYLIAVSTANPDQACAWLLREMRATGHSVNENALLCRFREVMPFRDSEWGSDCGNTGIAEYLFVHWRLVREYGLRPQSHVTGFYRCLFQFTAWTRRLAPHSDPLRRALQDVRALDVFTHFQDMMTPQYVRENMDQYVTLMMRMPNQLDAALTLANDLQTQRSKVEGQGGRQQAFSAALALLLVWAAIVLLISHFATLAISNPWIDRISIVLLLLVGILLLRIVNRV